MQNKMVKDVFYTFSTTIIITVLGFVSSIIVASLGPEQKGILTTVLFLPTILYTFINFGIEAAVMYYGAKEKNFASISRIINKVAVFFSIIAVLAGLAAIVAGSVFTQYYKDVPFLYLGSILLIAPLNFYLALQLALLRSENNFVKYNLVNTVKQIVYFVAILFIFVYKSIWVVIAANYIMLIVGILLCKIKVHHKNDGENRPYIKNLINFGLKAYFSNVISFFNYRFDLTLLTPLVSKSQIGLYSVAQNLSELIWMIPNSVAIVLVPRIAAMGEEERRAVTLRVCRYVATVMIAVVALGYLLAGIMIPFVYSKAYDDSVNIFRILLAGTFIMTYSKILGNAIAAYGQPEKNIIPTIAGSAVNVILNLILIPRYGIIGAAIAGSISYSVSGIMTTVVFIRMNHGKVRLMDFLVMNRGDVSTLFRLILRRLRRNRSVGGK